MKPGLADIRCASVADVKLWAEAARATPHADRVMFQRDPLAVFCADGNPVWCRGEAQAGRCCRSIDKERSSTSLRDLAASLR